METSIVLTQAAAGLWYAQPLNRDTGTVDTKLATFLTDTGCHSHVQQEYIWMGKDRQAALDQVVTWNYHLPPHISRPNPKSYKKFDHNQIWTQPLHVDFPEHTHLARTSPRLVISPSGSTRSSLKDTQTTGEHVFKITET